MRAPPARASKRNNSNERPHFVLRSGAFFLDMSLGNFRAASRRDAVSVTPYAVWGMRITHRYRWTSLPYTPLRSYRVTEMRPLRGRAGSKKYMIAKQIHCSFIFFLTNQNFVYLESKRKMKIGSGAARHKSTNA